MASLKDSIESDHYNQLKTDYSAWYVDEWIHNPLIDVLLAKARDLHAQLVANK